MTGTGRWLAGVALVAWAAWFGMPGAAAAHVGAPNRIKVPASSEVGTLCQDATVPCSLQADRSWPEGATSQVVVTGRADVTVRVQAYRADIEDGAVTALEPYGESSEATLDGDGFATVDLMLPTLPDGETGGPVLVSLAGVRSTDVEQILGTWTVLTSRAPRLLGDGYGQRKPVGRTLALRLDSAPQHAAFEVEVEVDGAWRSASAAGPARCGEAGRVCDVDYQVPRGLPAQRHRFRLVSAATGTPVGSWWVVPDGSGTAVDRPDAMPPPVGTSVPGALTAAQGARPVPQARSRNLDIPDVAADVTGAGLPQQHDVAQVRNVAVGLGVLGLVLIAVSARPRRLRRDGATR